MPKRKTGQRKKADKQRQLQAKIRVGGKATERDIAEFPCNVTMECDSCNRKQKNRAFCYFCSSIQRVPICGHCGKIKCFARSGDCLIKHPNRFAAGMEMVGAICDFCEAWICHSRKCLATHACMCPLTNCICTECKRDVWLHGGKVYKCAHCNNFLCEDDQFEHQASCAVLEQETYKCLSCNRLSQYNCMRCKLCFCEEHVKRKGVKYAKGKAIPCPKCGLDTSETNERTVSVRKHEFGRQTVADDDDDYGENEYYNMTPSWARVGAYSGDAGGAKNNDEEEEDDDDDDDDDEGDDDDSDDDSEDDSHVSGEENDAGSDKKIEKGAEEKPYETSTQVASKRGEDTNMSQTMSKLSLTK